MQPSATPPVFETAPAGRRGGAGCLWNLFTLAALLAAAGVAVIVFLIYNDPASSLNPFPAPTHVATLFIPTQKPSPSVTQPAPTLAPSPTPTAIKTPAGTPLPPTPTAMPATPVPTLGPTPTATYKGYQPYAFVLQAEPRAIDASLFNAGRACQWMGVAGQAFDLKNSPVALGIIVQVGGVVDNQVINITSLTGTAVQYGTAGYEVTLASRPAASKGQVWVRLLDQAGLAISDRVFFDTFSDCTKNLIIVNFKQVK
jgi:hypothetical protein